MYLNIVTCDIWQMTMVKWANFGCEESQRVIESVKEKQTKSFELIYYYLKSGCETSGPQLVNFELVIEKYRVFIFFFYRCVFSHAYTIVWMLIHILQMYWVYLDLSTKTKEIH